ncbi:MAG TPA: cytochrome c biogenesis protein ResB [Jatrophihabitantaceae bacterium]|nr:cytochrome c biogenesis protein ResB [Jatrophihabitantaceae bacterium]
MSLLTAVATPRRILRRAWRRLVSMRTALILLFLLAVAAVPGSLLPQWPLNPTKVTAYIASHGWWGHLLDHLGFFDVFASTWFAAIYLLLFISLVGCLIPRVRVHARAMRAKPLPAPKHLDRLPESGAFETSASAAEFSAAARGTLGRRWRVVERADGDTVTLSAEKGYSRETGNLVFHIALLVALIAIAIGRLYNYEGSIVVLQGANQGFCNTVTSYDSWQPGRFASEGKVSPAPFCLAVDKFTAKYDSAGEPTEFAADVAYGPVANTRAHQTVIKVNHPLRLEGDRVYLISHGFAPEITVHMPDGSTQHSVQAFIPTDPATLYSEGAFKLQGPQGKNEDVGIEGFFAPTPATADGSPIASNSVITSSSPQVSNPVLGITVYTGDIGYDKTGPQNVYSLDTSAGTLKQLGMANLVEGQTTRMAGGVSVTFDGWIPWAGMQVSHDPSQDYLLVAAAAMVLGLIGSLSVRRRRVWLRVAPATPGDHASPTVVSVGGLARSDSGNFTEEFSALFERLRASGPPVEAGNSGSLRVTRDAGKERSK